MTFLCVTLRARTACGSLRPCVKSLCSQLNRCYRFPFATIAVFLLRGGSNYMACLTPPLPATKERWGEGAGG